MGATTPANKLLPLHDLVNVNTVIGMLYDENGVYRAAFDPDVFYNTILLDTLKYGEENYVHLKYAESLTIRRGASTARFRRWSGMTPTLRPLKEGIPPAPDKHAYETLEVGNVFSFGRWSEYTDRVDLSIINEVISERSLQYGEVANQTKELYARKTWLSSPNEFYANFKDFDTLGFGDGISLDDLRFLVARMKRMQVKPVNGKFNYICSPEFINGLIDDARVKSYMAINQTTGNLWTTGEPFPLFELEFIPTMLDEFAYPDTEYPGVYELADGTEAIRLYAVGSTTYNATDSTYDTPIYYLDVHQNYVLKSSGAVKAKSIISDKVTYLNDGTAVEDFVTWEIPLDADAFEAYAAADAVAGTDEVPGIVTSGEATSVKTVFRKATKSVHATTREISYTPIAAIASTDLTAALVVLNSLIDAGAFMQLPIHRGILFGAEAMIKLNVEGISDQPEIIIQPLGSSGVADPIKQRQSVGFKVDGFGLAIKRPEAVCVTYGIPKFAEMAALTSKVISGNFALMDDRKLDDGYANYIATTGEQALRVDGINLGGYPGEPNISGNTVYAKFNALVNYSIGDKVLYRNKPYVFIATHEAAAWSAAHVAAAKDATTLTENPLVNDGNDSTSNVK